MAEGQSKGTATSRFGVGRREAHDASEFYARFRSPDISDDDTVVQPFELTEPLVCGDSRSMVALPDNSVALVVTSPPYFAGKEYEQALGHDHVPADYLEFLAMLRDVFAECRRVLEPGGRLAVNVANLGRKPYRSLASDVIRILQDDLGLLLRGEIVWAKAEGASGSCAWGSFRSPANPVLRDVTERVVVASKGRFDRARSQDQRRAAGLPHRATVSNDEFLEATLDLWRLPSESARRVRHPAPFPVELPARLIDLYTYENDLVLDPFLGSGTTAVAAVRKGRRFAGYDTDPGYVAIARERVAAELERLSPNRQVRPLRGAGEPAAGYGDRAAAIGKSVGGIAETVVTEAGFEIVDTDRRVPGAGITVDLVARDRRGVEWFFDVSGGFTAMRSGLVRTDILWRCLGRVSVLAARGVRPLVLLTSHLPARRSAGDQAMRAIGPAGFFDAVELLADDDRQRLAAYADGGRHHRPLTGFWTAPELRGAPPAAANGLA